MIKIYRIVGIDVASQLEGRKKKSRHASMAGMDERL
jgi:hypothetical protein